MAQIISVNLGSPRPAKDATLGISGIDKRPVAGPVDVAAPGPRGRGTSGLAGDAICDLRHHGGDDQAVYAYAREDLDGWARELGRELPSGVFGENLTTTGLAVTEAVIGERWRVGERLVLEVSVPRVPCRTFAGWLGEKGWIRRFVAAAVPGTYLRVITSGQVRAGDPVTVVDRPSHGVTVGLAFRALTTESELLPRLLDADALPVEVKEQARKRTVVEMDVDLR